MSLFTLYLKDGGSLSINSTVHCGLPLLHTLLAVLLQLCIASLDCSQVHLLALPDQSVVFLHAHNPDDTTALMVLPMPIEVFQACVLCSCQLELIAVYMRRSVLG